MVAIFKNEFNHPFYAVALTKESAINTLYERFASSEHKEWYKTPARWWEVLTSVNGREPFIIREREVF